MSNSAQRMIGTTILNRFHVTEQLGSGGFGTVYRAWDDRLEREVAVKVIETGPESGRRVLREAQAAARLNHPGIVTLFEFGHHEFGREGGRAFLVSELVEGETVRELIDREELTDREVAEMGADLCEALDHAHERGVVHRDVKPANLISPGPDERVKLMDFGIARLTDGEDLTVTGNVIGTLSYMSPEQAEGETAGPESDVFSLSLTLYEGWAGVNPRRRLTPGATARALVEQVPSLAEYRGDLPEPIIDVIDAGLDPVPDYRPSLEDLGVVLEEHLDELEDSAPAHHRFQLGAPVRTPADVGSILAAAGVAGMSAATMIAAGGAGPLTVGLLTILPAILTLFAPRAGFLAAGAAVAAWLTVGAGMPGAALLLLLLTVPPAVLVTGEGRALVLGPLGPILGAVGAAPFLPILAGFTGRWRDRVVIAVSGLSWTALAQCALHRDLLYGPLGAAPDGWQESPGAAIRDVLAPTVTSATFLVSAAVWAAVSLLAGAVISVARARRAATGSGSEPRAPRPAPPRPLRARPDRTPSLP